MIIDLWGAWLGSLISSKRLNSLPIFYTDSISSSLGIGWLYSYSPPIVFVISIARLSSEKGELLPRKTGVSVEELSISFTFSIKKLFYYKNMNFRFYLFRSYSSCSIFILLSSSLIHSVFTETNLSFEWFFYSFSPRIL